MRGIPYLDRSLLNMIIVRRAEMKVRTSKHSLIGGMQTLLE
jgi:hypothetical protein